MKNKKRDFCGTLGPIILLLIIFCCIIPALPVTFELRVIDWTAISSILTFCAIVISIISNQTAQKTLKATIAIQEQNKGLSLMEKRVTIIKAIKAGNFKDLNESDVLYYFDETCSTLFQTYSQKYITSRVKYQIYHDFFSDLRKQYYEQTDSKNLNQTMEDIENFERLAQGLSFLESQDLDEYTHLAKKYPLYKPDIDDNGIPISRFFSYDELSDAYELALKEKNIAYQKLTDKMEDLIFSSITLKI